MLRIAHGLVLLAFAGLAQAAPLEVKWRDLAPLIHRKTIRLVLNDGIPMQGKVVEVSGDGLLLDLAGNGRRMVPRDRVTTLELRVRRPLRGVVAGVAGAAAVAGLLALQAAANGGAGSLEAAGVIAAVSAVAGIDVGAQELRGDSQLIRVLPD